MIVTCLFWSLVAWIGVVHGNVSIRKGKEKGTCGFKLLCTLYTIILQYTQIETIPWKLCYARYKTMLTWVWCELIRLCLNMKLNHYIWITFVVKKMPNWIYPNHTLTQRTLRPFARTMYIDWKVRSSCVERLQWDLNPCLSYAENTTSIVQYVYLQFNMYADSSICCCSCWVNDLLFLWVVFFYISSNDSLYKSRICVYFHSWNKELQ